MQGTSRHSDLTQHFTHGNLLVPRIRPQLAHAVACALCVHAKGALKS